MTKEQRAHIRKDFARMGVMFAVACDMAGKTEGAKQKKWTALIKDMLSRRAAYIYELAKESDDNHAEP